MVIALRVVQFWSEIKLEITNRTPASRSFDFVISRLISDQIALHSVPITIIYHRGMKAPILSMGLRSIFDKFCMHFFFVQGKVKQGLSAGKDDNINVNDENVFAQIGNTLCDACNGKKPEEVNIE